MKSRRVLQIIVAALSIALLACMALVAVLLIAINYVPSLPKAIVDFGRNFSNGMKAVADRYYLYDAAVPALVAGVPGLLLLGGVLLLLVRKKGVPAREVQNVVGCIFSLLGATLLAAFLMLFAKSLFAESLLLIVYCACGGVLALFVLFVGLALGIKPKRIVVADDSHEVEQTETPETKEVGENNTTTEKQASAVDEADEEEAEQDTYETSEGENTELEYESEESENEATQYVPNLGVTIHDVVERTYGKESDSLTKNTIEKINKVRALYEANAITEQEYIKLIRKYLGF